MEGHYLALEELLVDKGAEVEATDVRDVRPGAGLLNEEPFAQSVTQ
jgi:hypothetical protein